MEYNQERKKRLVGIVNELSKIISTKLPGESNDVLHKTFQQCFVNTVETTVECINGDEIFLITGDIEAMWLRDSSAQVVHYLPFLSSYPELADMVKSLLNKQFQYISIDPYANAFNIEPNGHCWEKDITKENPWNWERKYEIDSLCYPVWLLHRYYEETKDRTVFTDDIKKTLQVILELWETEQHHEEKSDYRFERLNCPPSDTLINQGKGAPSTYTGLLWSGFRPSDDACEYGYLIPSNLFAGVVLEYIKEYARDIYHDITMEKNAEKISRAIREGIAKHAVYHDEEAGDIYAYETDGFGNYNLMDDANVPSLLSLPWLSCCDREDELYKNTRKFVLSKRNPYYYQGKAASGIGSPHTPDQYIWHIALTMQGLTSNDEKEKEELLSTLLSTDAGTGFMHEGFHCDDPEKYTRSWFAWANSLFALYCIDLYCK